MNSVDETSRRRRVSHSQLEVLWEFLNSHKDLAVGFNKSAQARDYAKRHWMIITDALNSQGEGATKDWKGWSNYWVDYKAKLKKRNAAVRASLNRTGGGPSGVPALTELEKKFLSLLGNDFGSGLPNIQVDPFPMLTEEVTVTETDVDLGQLQIPQVQTQEEEVQPQEEEVQLEEGSVFVTEQSTRQEVTGPSRRRRARQGHMSQETARRTLVDTSRARLGLEERKCQILENILNTLNRIADSIDT